MKGKIGFIDVGGGLRGVYAAGVLDFCMDQGLSFDLGIGVSAGSANLASYAAAQPRRNLRFYTEYALRKEYMGLESFLLKRSFIDLDYFYGTLSNSSGESPLDYPALLKNPMDMIVVATDAETGCCRYFSKDDIQQDCYDIFKASSAIPFVCKPYRVNGIAYYDGALSDPVPVQKAFDMGCEKVVLILTLPEDTVRQPDKDKRLAARIRKKYPLAAKKLEGKANLYNQSVSLARQYAAQGKLLIVAPDSTCGATTLKRNRDALLQLYQKGYRDGEKIPAFLSERS